MLRWAVNAAYRNTGRWHQEIQTPDIPCQKPFSLQYLVITECILKGCNADVTLETLLPSSINSPKKSFTCKLFPDFIPVFPMTVLRLGGKSISWNYCVTSLAGNTAYIYTCICPISNLLYKEKFMRATLYKTPTGAFMPANITGAFVQKHFVPQFTQKNNFNHGHCCISGTITHWANDPFWTAPCKDNIWCIPFPSTPQQL